MSTSSGEGVSVETAAVAAASTAVAVAMTTAITGAEVIDGGDDVFDDDDDWWDESIESPVAEAATMASSLTSGGRASKRRQVGVDEPIKNVKKLDC